MGFVTTSAPLVFPQKVEGETREPAGGNIFIHFIFVFHFKREIASGVQLACCQTQVAGDLLDAAQRRSSKRLSPALLHPARQLLAKLSISQSGAEKNTPKTQP
jgi:hypothetical protein